MVETADLICVVKGKEIIVKCPVTKNGQDVTIKVPSPKKMKDSIKAWKEKNKGKYIKEKENGDWYIQ